LEKTDATEQTLPVGCGALGNKSSGGLLGKRRDVFNNDFNGWIDFGLWQLHNAALPTLANFDLLLSIARGKADRQGKQSHNRA
jgi:hypothetical protein